MSCTPGELSASNRNIGRRLMLTKACPASGNTRLFTERVCAIDMNSPGSAYVAMMADRNAEPT